MRPFSRTLLQGIIVVLSLALAACTVAPNTPASTQAPARTDAGVSSDKPFLMDHDARTLYIYATVNGKYLFEPTRHGLNFVKGKNAPAALFVTPVDQNDFYEALIHLEARPGNNLNMQSKGMVVEGQPLEVKVTWAGAGKEYDINEVVVDSTGKGIAYRFGGNLEASKEYLTGCFLCLDSCPVGIASNYKHAVGEFAAGSVQFRGNKDVLPPDGTAVTFIVKVVD